MKQPLVSFFAPAALTFLVSCSSIGLPSLGGLLGDSQSEPPPVGQMQVSQQQVAMAQAQPLSVAEACPPIEIRQDTGVYSLYAQGRDHDPQGLRFQANIEDVVRSCESAGDQILVKVGVAGRVLSGPAGGPARLTLPVRIAVVDQITGVATYSQLHNKPVSIEPPEVSASFSLVDNTVLIDRATGSQTKVIYVGFDSRTR
jgi:hypothetical protein